MPPPIYLDYAASCPCDPWVVKAMAGSWGCANAASGHRLGLESREQAIDARRTLARSLGCRAREIYWMSGATEANNLAITGYAGPRPRVRIITCATEHKSVLRPAQATGRAIVLGVSDSGLVSLQDLSDAIEPGALVSIAMVNNETGVIQPWRDIASLCVEGGAIYHCDATQGLGRLPIDLRRWPVHMVSLSSHKVCGPKGIGALFIREGVELAPQILGGRQERSLRAGTTPTPLCVGFATAARIAVDTLPAEHARIAALRAAFLDGLTELEVPFRVTGSDAPRVPAIVSLCLPGDASQLLEYVSREICVSTGSACSLDGPSHVLAAMGIGPECATLRVSFGRWTTLDDTQRAARVISDGVRFSQ